MLKLRGIEEEKKKAENYKINQKQMKQFLDMQVQEKENNKKYENHLNHEQARIWKQDATEFINQERMINHKVIILILLLD
jgi:hypothetical protein